MMVEIRTLAHLDLEDLRRLIVGYVANEKYLVHRHETNEQTVFSLERVPLIVPYHKRYSYLDAELVTRYEQFVPTGFSLGA
jgi:hypothetical protein